MVDIAKSEPAPTVVDSLGAGKPEAFGHVAAEAGTFGFDVQEPNRASDADAAEASPQSIASADEETEPRGFDAQELNEVSNADAAPPLLPRGSTNASVVQDIASEETALPSPSKSTQGVTAQVDPDRGTDESCSPMTPSSGSAANTAAVVATPTETTPPAGLRHRSSIQTLDAYRDDQAVERQVSSARRVYSPTSSSSSMSSPAFKAEAFFLTHALEEPMEAVRHASRSQRDRPSVTLGALAETGDVCLPGGLAILRLVHQCPTQTPKFKRSKSTQASTVNLRKIKRTTVKSAAKRAAAEADEGLLIERLDDFMQQGFTVEDLNRADDKTGETPLHLMAAKNLAQAIKATVKLGAVVNPCDAEGITPLLTAAQHGADGAARALLELGARPELASLRGELPLHEALMRGHYLTAEAMLLTGLVNVDLCNAVVDRGKAKPLMYQSSPLNAVLAAKAGPDLLACCRVLCKYGPSLVLKSEVGNGLTPLELCIKRPEISGCLRRGGLRCTQQLHHGTDQPP